MSTDQKNFLRKVRNQKILVISMQILIITLFFTIWEYLSRNNFINSFLYSNPTKIFNTLKDLYITNYLFVHIFTTIKEILISFMLGMILGFIIAVVFYEFKLLAKIVDPFLTMLNSLPKVALGPLIIIIMGANIKSIIVMAILINLVVTIVTIYNGLIKTDENKLKLMHSFGASKAVILKKLIIPNSYNIIISSLKLNISLTLIGVIMGEFLVSKAGIGYLIIYGTQIFNLNLVMAGIVLLILISLILYQIVVIIEKKLKKGGEYV